MMPPCRPGLVPFIFPCTGIPSRHHDSLAGGLLELESQINVASSPGLSSAAQRTYGPPCTTLDSGNTAADDLNTLDNDIQQQQQASGSQSSQQQQQHPKTAATLSLDQHYSYIISSNDRKQHQVEGSHCGPITNQKTRISGTLRKNRKTVPKNIISQKFKRDQIAGKESEGVKIMKWCGREELQPERPRTPKRYHTLTVGETENKMRRKCVGCYKLLRRTMNSREADKKMMSVTVSGQNIEELQENIKIVLDESYNQRSLPSEMSSNFQITQPAKLFFCDHIDHMRTK
ncbi:unnamed protein product [Acanthoscelides obtectus]|uniref:Uncharacterized protein n=1 Tax=Acanthoscelides obtectus TaxID=200917 RepID=A0A9P0M4Z8_ACAOB|nr:unnamed protein product [Acanthoscelides obtectus]CAK1661735.1 hypothetical protein AOBTE_LOCUS22764 [Acanthoscelides obtectus]